jgi:hypothetical protein
VAFDARIVDECFDRRSDAAGRLIGEQFGHDRRMNTDLALRGVGERVHAGRRRCRPGQPAQQCQVQHRDGRVVVRVLEGELSRVSESVTENDLVRRAKRRLAVFQHAEEVSGNVAATCRHFGISRTVFYRCKRRYVGRGHRRAQGPLERPDALPERHPARSRRKDHPPAAALPLRPDEDRDVARRKRYHQYTAIGDCTRLRVLRIYRRSDQKTAVRFLDYVIARLPFQVEKIQTDNGAEFQPSFH